MALHIPIDNKPIRAHKHPSQRVPSQSPSGENGHRWLSHPMPVRIRHCPRCWLRSPALCMCSWSRMWQCCRRVHQGSSHSLCRQMHHSYMGQCSTMAHCTMRPAGTGAFALEVSTSDRRRLRGQLPNESCTMYHSLQDNQ